MSYPDHPYLAKLRTPAHPGGPGEVALLSPFGSDRTFFVVELEGDFESYRITGDQDVSVVDEVGPRLHVTWEEGFGDAGSGTILGVWEDPEETGDEAPPPWRLG